MYEPDNIKMDYSRFVFSMVGAGTLLGFDLRSSSSSNIPRGVPVNGLRGTFSTGWPGWSTTRRNPDERPNPITFNLRMATNYQEYDTVQGTNAMFTAIKEMANEL
jgi:hypothetical protein